MNKPLKGIRILSLALNLPGPAALMRCVNLGATCVKLEPLSGDPMFHYSPAAYAQLHAGVKVKRSDLKTDTGQRLIHALLAKTDVLLTSFRPSALTRLGLDFRSLQKQHPHLSMVCIVGGDGSSPEQAEIAGHDLTYMAERGLVKGLELPATLFADMSGSLLAMEAIQSAALLKYQQQAVDKKLKGQRFDVPLGAAAKYCALPFDWGMTKSSGAVGGAHAGYKLYACKDGRVAVAALEPHFALRLLEVAGLSDPAYTLSNIRQPMFDAAVHAGLVKWFKRQACEVLEQLAAERDLPLLAMPGQ